MDQVVEYFYAGTDQEVWSRERDFPFLIPPFDDVWLESNKPSRIVSEAHGVRAWDGAGGMAALIKRENAPADGVNRISREYAKDYPRLPEGTQHIVFVSVWLEFASGLWPAIILTLCLDRYGSPLHHRKPDGDILELVAVPQGEAMAERDEGFDVTQYLRETQPCIDPFLLALSFLNCRTAETSERPVPRHERKRSAKDGRAIAKHYVLTIDALKRVVSDRIDATGESLQLALHICRGHFATYSDDHPLFGKYTGKFWRPAHVRGRPDAGVVTKDYAMSAP